MGKYKIEFKRSAYRDLKKIPGRKLKGILNKISNLADNPRPPGCRKIIASDNYRIRYREYRIIYSIKDDVLVVHIIKIGQRKDIYRI